MTSNGEAALNPPSTAPGTLDESARQSHPPPSPPTLASSPRAPKTASPASSKDRLPSAPRLQNGDHADDDAQNESEAETVVLGDSKDHTSKEKKLIKTERDDDDDDGARLRSIKEASRARSPDTNGRKNSGGSDFKVNGAKHGSERDAKSPIPTSPSSRTTSRHTKDGSPADSVKSPAQSATSPPLPSTRGRSSSTVESRKRKLRDESGPKSLEPPRQKAKTEGLKDSRTNPNSPITPGPGRPHKRSQSTQSVIGLAGRKRRELTAIALPTERRQWSDDSSDNSSSPRPAQTPSALSHSRTKRSSHRALTSPARAMPHKRNVDKFGATRLARESEKGDLPAVRAAYNAAPEELDQEDFAGIAPLQKAALNGNDDVVAFLIKKGCRTDCESNDRDTPLIDAVENGHLETIKLLLNEGHVNPHHQNKKGQRAIDVLDPDDEDHEEIEKVLKESMRRHADTSKTEDSQPVLTQQKSASRLLYNEYNTETLVEKAGDGDIAAVGELINSNIKPNIACGVAASRGGHYDILSILLASGLKADPDPSKHSETPMLVAIGRGHLKIVQLLLEQDVFNPTRRNREGKTYWEISEERRGPKWEQERDVLKDAYTEYLRTHKSPKRSKKEAPNPSVMRAKRKSSPIRREHSSSPQPESKRAHLPKSSAVPAQGPQKSRRLLSGKEMANRENKRRRRVVSDESSEDESNDDAKAPRKKSMAKPRSFSDGEEHKTVKKLKAHSEDAPKRQTRARSDDSDDDRQPKRNPKIRTKTIRSKPTPTPEVESPDERKPGKKLAKARALDEKIKKRRASDVSIDHTRLKKAPTSSAKSTPAPPEKASTPDVIREQRREEAEKQAAEAKRKAAEAEAKKREEEAAREAAREAAQEAVREAAREAARKAAEEEEARKKAEAEAEAEAKRLAEEAEAARIRAEEEEARKRAEEEARRQEELVARQVRISKLPRALRRACEMGNNRPLHFSGEELGISAIFLPLFFATSKDLSPNEHQNAVSKSYIMSFQAVGILGLPELDLARLEAPYSAWERISVTRKQRELLLRQYDVALLAQDFRFPMEGTEEFDYCKIQESIKEARQQFLDMDGLYWIEDTCLYPEVEKIESLAPLLDEIKDVTKRRQVHVVELVAETTPEKKHRPRKSFMDVVLGQTGFNGIAEAVKVNGDG